VVRIKLKPIAKTPNILIFMIPPIRWQNTFEMLYPSPSSAETPWAPHPMILVFV
jgi:hypothetical protein